MQPYNPLRIWRTWKKKVWLLQWRNIVLPDRQSVVWCYSCLLTTGIKENFLSPACSLTTFDFFCCFFLNANYRHQTVTVWFTLLQRHLCKVKINLTYGTLRKVWAVSPWAAAESVPSKACSTNVLLNHYGLWLWEYKLTFMAETSLLPWIITWKVSDRLVCFMHLQRFHWNSPTTLRL